MIKPIETRRSIRKYTNQPVEDDKIMAMLESGRLAPSGHNTQPWHFILVKSEQLKLKLAEVSHNQKWMLTAPLFIAVVADIRCRIKDQPELTINELSPQFEVKQIIRDTSIAIEHLILEATNQGLGTCWVAWYLQEEIRPILNIPSDKFVVGIVTVGYADEQPAARPRRPLTEMVHYETW